MTALAVSSVVFACIFGVALVAMFVKRLLPEHHLSADSKDFLKLGMGTIATLTALVLGLLIATAKGTYDAQGGEVQELSVKVMMLNRILEKLEKDGLETDDARELLKKVVVAMQGRLWPAEGAPPADLTPGEARAPGEALYDKIAGLKPKNDAQRDLKTRALQVAAELLQVRLRLYSRRDSTLPTPLLVVLVSWLVVLFTGYGLLAPRNLTVMVVLFVCALSVSGAILLLLEFTTPFEGLLKLSSSPLQDALASIGK